MNSPTFGVRLMLIEKDTRAIRVTLADLEKRLRKQESWRWYALCALAAGANALDLLRGCA